MTLRQVGDDVGRNCGPADLLQFVTFDLETAPVVPTLVEEDVEGVVIDVFDKHFDSFYLGLIEISSSLYQMPLLPSNGRWIENRFG